MVPCQNVDFQIADCHKVDFETVDITYDMMYPNPNLTNHYLALAITYPAPSVGTSLPNTCGWGWGGSGWDGLKPGMVIVKSKFPKSTLKHSAEKMCFKPILKKVDALEKGIEGLIQRNHVTDRKQQLDHGFNISAPPPKWTSAIIFAHVQVQTS
jgi:hypothetical protein